MDLFLYRGKVRVVAIVDLVLTGMSICMLTLLLAAAFCVSFYGSFFQQLLQEYVRSVYGISVSYTGQNDLVVPLIILWVAFFVLLPFIVLQVVTAVKLLNATQTGLDPKNVRTPARFWRIFTVAFTWLEIPGLVLHVLHLTQIFIVLTLVFCIPYFIFKGIGFKMVGKFMEEARLAAMPKPKPLTSRLHGNGDQGGSKQKQVEAKAIAPKNGPVANKQVVKQKA